MSVAIRANFEEVRRLAFGGISGVFAGIGTEFAHPARVIYLKNNTDVALTFSNDGILDKLDLDAWESTVLDLSSNKTIENGFCLKETTRIYVREHPLVLVAPTIGYVSLSVVYGETGY